MAQSKAASGQTTKIALFKAAISFYSLYYRTLLIYFLKNIDLLRPRSLPYSLKMIQMIYKVRGYTAVFIPRLAALYTLANEIDRRQIPGDIVECGVYNGGSAALMAAACRDSTKKRHIWLFDSFEGLPLPTDNDGEKAQTCGWWCHGDLEKVVKILRKMRIPEYRIHITKGWFHETFPLVEIEKIALLHIDADWYDSVKLCLERFYEFVRPGGYVVIDDYGHWEGCKKATDEFLEEQGINVELVTVDYTGRYFRKPI